MDWRGLYHRIRGLAQDRELVQDSAAELGLDAKRKLLSKQARAEQVLCPEGHVLYRGQRPEDCYDCFQVGIARAEHGQERPLAPGQLQGALLCLRGFHEGSVFALRLAEDVPVYLGSDPSCDIVLSDPQISRKHLMVVSRQGRTIVRDLNSLHHSALRAKDELQWYVLDPEREYWCEDGAQLVMGEVELLYRTAGGASLRGGGPPLLQAPQAAPLPGTSSSLAGSGSGAGGTSPVVSPQDKD